jgi:hypothetical protein
MAAPQDFLSVLDALIRSDGGPAGVSGILAFCSREPAGLRWWQVVLSDKAEGAFVDAPDEHADVLVGLRPHAADAPASLDAVLEDRVNLIFSGDGELLDRFIQRYPPPPASSLGIRFGVST